MQLIVYPKLLKERLKATQQRLNSYNQKIQEDKKKIERGGIFGIFTKGLTATTLELNQIIQKKLEDNLSEIKEEMQLIEKIDILTPGDIAVRLGVLRRQDEETQKREKETDSKEILTSLFGGPLSDLDLVYHLINKNLLRDAITELEIFQKEQLKTQPGSPGGSYDEKLKGMKEKLAFGIEKALLETKMETAKHIRIDEEKEKQKKEATEALLKRYGARKVEELSLEGFKELKKTIETIDGLFEDSKAKGFD